MQEKNGKRLDFQQVLKDFEGEPFTVPGENSELTLGRACIIALSANYPDERDLSGEEKYKRFQLMGKIYDDADGGAFKPEEKSLIKRIVAKAWTPVVMGRIWDLIDNS